MTLHSSLRVLAAEEIQAVSGGDIVVTGTPPIDPFILDQLNQMRFFIDMSMFGEAGLGGGGGVGSGEPGGDDNWDPDGDDDGDGIPNSEEEIVVTANAIVHFADNVYGRYDGGSGTWMLFSDGWFWDEFMGYYVPGTPDNHTFAIQDPNYTLRLDVRGVEVAVEAEENSIQYWTLVPPPAGN